MSDRPIVGRRVTLRPFGPEQITERYLGWLNDPGVNRYSRRLNSTTSVAEARAWLDSLGEDECVLGIHLPDVGHVGNIKYGPIDWARRLADISIVIGEPEVWGQGVGAESVYLVSRYLFKEKGLERVAAGSINLAFIRLVEKLGWTVEQVDPDDPRVREEAVPYTVFSQKASAFTRLECYEAA